MPYYLKILILAIIQGAAELLPVSSSAHVILAEKLMDLPPEKPEQTFLLIMLHTGTMFAVIVYFWPRWKPLLLPQSRPQGGGQSVWVRYRFVWMALLATVVTGTGIGLILLIEKVTHSEVEELFKRLDLIGAALLAVGIFILIAGFFEIRAKRDDVTPMTAVLIGLIQAVCLPFRGFSRSGAKI
jgi:undecaprenyl-diphosphatase